MAPPSRLAITTSSVSRLLKEEASYHKEMEQQKARVKKQEENPSGENSDFILKQELQALKETENVFPPLRLRIDDSVSTLELQISSDEGNAPPADLSKARDVLAQAKSSRPS